METVNETRFVELTNADRCDACGAQAKVRASMPSGELLFCAHHGRAFKVKLESVATIKFADQHTADLVLGA